MSLVAYRCVRTAVFGLMFFLAVTASTINVVGGFLITDRILKMFKASR